MSIANQVIWAPLFVGSIYGGIIFDFTEGKVSRMFFGAAAEWNRSDKEKSESRLCINLR